MRRWGLELGPSGGVGGRVLAVLRRGFWAGIALGLAAGPALAHPHVFIDTGLEVVLDAQNRAVGLRITWTYDDLNHYLYDPRQFVPGNKMSFAGLKNDQERADVIAYLRQQNDKPPPLPEVKAAPEAEIGKPAPAVKSAHPAQPNPQRRR